MTPTAGQKIQGAVVYREIRTWNNNGWSRGYAPAPWLNITIGSSTFGSYFRLYQKNLSNTAWNEIRRRSGGTSSTTWAQFRETFGDRRPRWQLHRFRTGCSGFPPRCVGNPNVQFRTGGGTMQSGPKIFWSNSSRVTPRTDDAILDAYKSEKGLLITVNRSQNVTS